jgi:fructosamine-3-kinase
MAGSVDDLRRELESATRRRLAPAPLTPLRGDSAAQSLRWESAAGPLFIKIAASSVRAGFAAEAAGLTDLASSATVSVPAVHGTGGTGKLAFIALEWLDLRAGSRAAEARLGEELAMLHRVLAPAFGWHRDNTLGPAAQCNEWMADWAAFFVQRRLVPQLERAERRGERGDLLDAGRELCEHVHLFFSGYRPVPSLLHGDLWGGNWGVDSVDRPYVFDPAVYYGDRETDLAMTHLFGGFGPAFYAGYQAVWPLDVAAGTRQTLYNLYHVLNHANLFGGGYAAQALTMTRRLKAEIGH